MNCLISSITSLCIWFVQIQKDFVYFPMKFISQLPYNGSTAQRLGPTGTLEGTESLCFQSTPKHPSPDISKHVFPPCQQWITGESWGHPTAQCHYTVVLNLFLQAVTFSNSTYGSMTREVHSVERNQAAHTLRSLTHPKLPVAESATGKTCARVQMFIFPSLPPSIHGVGGTVAGGVGRGHSCPIHLCLKSAALVMTPLHLHGLNSHPSNFSLSVDLVKMKIEIRN